MKVIVFDMDDTLYDQIEPFRLAVEAFFPQHFNDDEMRQLYQRFRFHSDALFSQTEDGTLALKTMRIYRMREAINETDLLISDAEADELQAAYARNQGKIQMVPEMATLLDELVQQKVPVALLTNGPESHQLKKVTQLGLSRWFPQEYWFISEATGCAKPDASAFRIVETAFQVTADDCLYIGDSYENDVIGCQNAGWRVVWLDKYQHSSLNDKSDYVISVENYQEAVREVHKLLNIDK